MWVSSDLAPILQIAAVDFDGLRVVERDDALDRALRDAEARVRERPPAAHAGVRTMFKRVGLDPTKTRPSSEALLRRVRRGEPLPRINSLVDVCNWCSLELQVPFGLYDRSRIEGDIELRLGRAGEEYAGIRKEVVHLEGRIVLVDVVGPFGNPSSDSARTLVSVETARALVVLFTPRDLTRTWIDSALDLTSQRVTRFAGGREVERRIV